MSIHVISHVLAHGQASTATEQAVALVLANYASHDGTRVFAGHKKIAKLSRTSVASVKRAIAALVARGDLQIQISGGGKGTNHYAFMLPAAYFESLIAKGVQVEPPVQGEPGLRSGRGFNVTPPPVQRDPTPGSACTPTGVRVSHDPLTDPVTDPVIETSARPARAERGPLSVQGEEAERKAEALDAKAEELLKEFDEQHRAAFGRPAPLEPRDRPLMIGLVKEHGADAVRSAAAAFMRTKVSSLSPARDHSVFSLGTNFTRLARITKPGLTDARERLAVAG